VTSERELLTQKFGKAGLSFQSGLGALIIKEVFGHFLGDTSFLTDAAVDGLAENSFIKTITEQGEVVQGDVGDIANKFIGMQRITLTDQNFYLFYKKGSKSKKQIKLIVLPLKYAKEVRTQGIIGKEVDIAFEVPQKEENKIVFFELGLGVFLPDIWMNTIKCAIREPLLDTTEEKVLGCIDINIQRRRHGLCFTKNRVIVAKTQISDWWLLLAIPCLLLGGLIFLPLTVFAFEYGYRSNAVLFFTIFLILYLGTPMVATTFNKRKYKKLLKLAPNDLLANDKKNFEIPYSNISQVEFKKGGFGSSSKIKILTNSESYQFGIVNKKLLKYHVSLARWVLPESKLILPEIKEMKLPKALQ
jgi:hypothetical protein